MVDPRPDAGVQAVQAALDAFGLGFQIVRLSESARTCRDAARVLGCPPAAIVKSLVLRGRRTGKAFLAEVSGSHRVNLELLAQAAGESLAMAEPEFVLSRTGFSIGGVAPVGLRHPVETFIDGALFEQKEIWASAGSEQAMFRLSPAQLVRITGGRTVRLADPE